MAIKWKREDLETLIKYVRQNECLYCVQSPDYLDRTKKTRAFDQILSQMKGSIDGEITLTELKRKWKNLRTQYSHELRLINQSRNSGAGGADSYAVKLWCFDQLSFLKPHTQTKASQDSGEDPNDDDWVPKINTTKWKRQQIMKLIILVEQNECLYNTQLPDYVNRPKKAAIFNEILEELQKDNSEITLEDIKSRWRNLRIQYMQELRLAVRRPHRSGTPAYVPKLWCYDQMSFLAAHVEIKAVEGILNSDSSSESDPIRSEWSKEETQLLIELLQDHPVLHETETNNDNVHKKAEALESIANQMNVIKPEITVKSIKLKIHNMRKELKAGQKMAKDTEAGTEGDKLTRCLNEELQFLLETNPESNGISNANEDPMAETSKFIYTSESDEEGKPVTKKRRCEPSQAESLTEVAMKSFKYLEMLVNKKSTPSREETFCSFLCSELQQLQNDEIFDKGKMQILTMVAKLKEEDRKLSSRTRRHKTP